MTQLFRIFISWSGDETIALAKVVHDLFEKVSDSFQPWYSEEGLRIGSFDQHKQILDKISASDAVILVVTRDNHRAPWLNYEAGAGSVNCKAQTKPVIPLLANLSVSEVSKPIGQYQSKLAPTKDDFWTLIKNFASLANLEISRVQSRFEDAWPKTQDQLKAALEKIGLAHKTTIAHQKKLNHERTPDRMVTRELRTRQNRIAKGINKLRDRLAPEDCEQLSQVLSDISYIIKHHRQADDDIASFLVPEFDC
ncbi:TIR domain-containing protein [Buchananella felis]|uniref:TIR domain-containing protein n=1 Tax=Buchananella felis TaxID=3231492 RepID=UPI0035270C68